MVRRTSRREALAGALLSLLALGVGATAPASAAGKKGKKKKMKSYAVGNVTFEGPDAGVEIKDAGEGAHQVSFAEPGAEPAVLVTLFLKTGAMLKEIPAPGQLAHFKTVFMATTKPAERQVSRAILGQTVSGDWQQGKIPRPLKLEAYRVELPGGDALFLGLQVLGDAPPDRAEAILQQFTSSLRLRSPGQQG